MKYSSKVMYLSECLFEGTIQPGKTSTSLLGRLSFSFSTKGVTGVSQRTFNVTTPLKVPNFDGSLVTRSDGNYWGCKKVYFVVAEYM